MILSHFPCKRACIYCLMAVIAMSSFQCSTMTHAYDWRDLPPYRPIRVETNSGEDYFFHRWHFTSDSALVGFTRESRPFQDDQLRPRWDIRRIPCDSIAAIYSVDRRPSSTGEVAFMVGGAAICAAFVWYVARALSFMPSGHW
jgi:hypothetical protein